jgi:putative PIN family toxin of toxin-antitoxin system
MQSDPRSLPLRLVLDTNVWLDWLVFDDPGIGPIRAAAEAGSAEIFITKACEQELERVLGYPMHKTPLTASAQAACLAQCRRVARLHARAAPLASAPEKQSPDTAVPKCKDPDDQKFLELARDCRADFLVSKDRDLLVFARRKFQYLPFRVITPRQFTGTK